MDRVFAMLKKSIICCAAFLMVLTIAVFFSACVPKENDLTPTGQTNGSLPDLESADSSSIDVGIAPSDLPDLTEPASELNPETDTTEPSSEIATIPVEEEGTVELEPGQGVGGF